MLLKCDAGEESLESLRLKEIQPLNPKGNQCWIFIGRTDAEAETPIFWSPGAKKGLTGKDPDAGKDWRQQETRNTEDKMVRRHHWLDGHEFVEALGVGDGHGSLACYSPWSCKESDTTKRLNWAEIPLSPPWRKVWNGIRRRVQCQTLVLPCSWCFDCGVW